MKKTYMEPQMIVEDFTVSEMIAKSCRAPSGEIGLIQQMTQFQPTCPSGAEPGWSKEMGTAYADLCDLYEGMYDVDHNPNTGTGTTGSAPYRGGEHCFTEAYYKHSGSFDAICSFHDESINFIVQSSPNNSSALCSDDEGILFNS